MRPALFLASPLFAFLFAAPNALGQSNEAPRTDILSATQWRQIDQSTERGLRFLANQQAPDGSIRSIRYGQPGVTALAVLAYLQQGHQPGRGPYGKTIDRALDYILRCQRRNGLLARVGPDGPIVLTPLEHKVGVAASYNNAIGGLALSEAYGMFGGSEDRLREPIKRALDVTLKMQRWPKQRPTDEGGIRYFHPFEPHVQTESDLSVMGWHLKFMRSAKNAGFAVPDEAIQDAVDYVLRCYTPKFGTFEYDVSKNDRRTRAMAGAGILALAHTGRHNRTESLRTADWLVEQSFGNYNRQARYGNFYHNSDRYHYGVFYCTLAMYQIGGRHWDAFFPRVVKTLLDNQNRDGSWDPEQAHDQAYGPTYTTSLVVLALGAPNQLLPIYQR